MEQALLDSSKYRIHSVSVDSRFADQYNKGTADFTLRLPVPIKNIQRIALSSVEIPLVEQLFSTTNGNLNFTLELGGTELPPISISAGNYTDTQLVSELEDALQAEDAAFTCSLSPTTGLLTITHPTTDFTLTMVSDNLEIADRPTHWGLGYYLGFRTKSTISSTGSGPYTLTATTVLLIQPTPYYLLQLWCPDQVQTITHCSTERSSIAAFAKLVLKNNVYAIQFNSNADFMRKEYTFLSPVNVSQLRVRLVDPYGCTVDMRSMDWSYTVELYEIVNSRTYAHMGLTYER
jgi:hypothetical protein